MDVLKLAVPRENYRSVSWEDDFQKVQVAPQIPERPRPQLIDPARLCGTQIQQWMATPPSAGFEWSCLFSGKLTVSGIGSLSLDGEAVLDPTLVPSYWLRNYFDNRYADFHADNRLPVKEIDAPCVSVVGWGWSIYGHFLIEALPKLLAVRSLVGADWASLLFLFRMDTPAWLLQICKRNLGLTDAQFVFFDPAKEKVALRRGIYPCLPIQAGCFHPVVAELMEKVEIRPSVAAPTARKLFISRLALPEARHQVRGCANEAELCDIAVSRGYEIYSPERDDWDTQITRLRGASRIVGLTGSGMHSALLCSSRPLIGFIGGLNMVQCQIASLMQQPFAALIDGVTVGKGFSVPEDLFRTFLDALDRAPVREQA